MATLNWWGSEDTRNIGAKSLLPPTNEVTEVENTSSSVDNSCRYLWNFATCQMMELAVKIAKSDREISEVSYKKKLYSVRRLFLSRATQPPFLKLSDTVVNGDSE
jgi:hypothetical protein